jgi:hypothetical protein
MWDTNAYSDCDSMAHTDSNCDANSDSHAYCDPNTDGNSNSDSNKEPNAYTKQHTAAHSDTQASIDSCATPDSTVERRNPFTEEQNEVAGTAHRAVLASLECDRSLKLPELLRSRLCW